MSIEMPAGLEWLSYLAGAAWPKGDEDSMFALDDDYKTAAKSLNGLIEQLHTACNTATDNYSGDGADKMKSQFDKFFSGDQSIAKMVENLNQIGKSAHDMGAEIEHTKLQVIITLSILAAEIAYALTTWFGAAVIPALEAETEGVMAVIGRTLATRLSWLVNHAKTIANMPLWKLAAISGVSQGALGLLTEVAVEGLQNAKGHIDGYDMKRIFVAGAVGAAGGAVGAPVGSVIGKGLGNWVTKKWGMTTTRATGVAFVAGVGGGLAGVGAGFVTGGLLTGEWEFDPAMLAGGAAGGMFGALHGSIGHARDAALAKSSTLHPTDLKISGGDHFDGSSGNSRPDRGGGGGRSIMPDRVDDNGNSGQRTRPSSSPGDGSENGGGRPSDRPGSERGDGESRGGSTGPREFHDSTAPAQPAPVRRGSISNISTFSNSSATPSRSSSIFTNASDGSSSHTSGSDRSYSAPPSHTREFGSTSEPVSRASSPGPQGSHEFRSPAEVTTQKSSVVPENLSRSPSVFEHSEGGFTAVASHTSDEVTPHNLNQVASHDSNEVVSRPPSEHEFMPSEREFTPSEADSRSVSESSMRGPASETSSLAGSEGPVRTTPEASGIGRHGGSSEMPSRPSTPEIRPSTPETRPSSPETHASTPETRPSTPETRPSTPETRASTPETGPVSRRPEAPISSAASDRGSRITASRNESGPADSTGQRHGREDQPAGPSSRASSVEPERSVGLATRRTGDDGAGDHRASDPDGQRPPASRNSRNGSGSHPESVVPERGSGPKRGRDETGDQELRRPRSSLSEDGGRALSEQHSTSRRDTPADQHAPGPQRENSHLEEVRAQETTEQTWDRINEAESRAAQERREQTDVITASKQRVEDARRELDQATDREAAEAVFERVMAEHEETVGGALDKLVEASRSSGGERWQAFLDGKISKDEAFEPVARERVEAAWAAAEARQEYFETQAGPGLPKDKSGPLTKLGDAELDDRIMNGSERDANAALNELNRRVTGATGTAKVKRPTQDAAELLAKHGLWEMDTGEGKEMTVVLRSVDIALDEGMAHVVTSSNPLVKHIEREFLNMVSERSFGIKVYHLDSDQPFPVREPGDRMIVAGTGQDYGFRAVKEAQLMFDELKQAGLSPEDLKTLRQGLEEAPNFRVYKELLDAAAESRGLDRRFEPFPGGKMTIDEIDAQLIDEDSHYVLSPGKGEKASPEFVAATKEIWNNLQRAKDEGVLEPTDFGKNPDISGMFDSELTGAGRDKLQVFLSRDITDGEAEEYAHAAQAEWGPQKDSHYLVSGDGDIKIKIIKSKTTDEVMDDPEKGSSSRWHGFAKYLELMHSKTDGRNITADPEYSVSITNKQLFTGGHFEISGTSGTLLTKTASTPRGVEDILHTEFGTGPIPRVERHFDSNMKRLPDQHFPDRDTKHAAMANAAFDGEVEVNPETGAEVPLRGAFVRNPETGALEQKGSPHLIAAMDNADVARIAEALRAEAAARNVPIKINIIDAATMDSFASKQAAQEHVETVVDKNRYPGAISIWNKLLQRGITVDVVKEAITRHDKNDPGGLKLMVSGGPAYSARVNHQVDNRVARSGDPTMSREEGGTPGQVKHYISPEDYLSSAPHPRVKTLVIQYQNAAKVHSEAEEAHNQATNENHADLDKTGEALQQARDELEHATAQLPEATELQKAAVEKQLIDSRRTQAYDAHAPPGMDRTLPKPPAPPPQEQTTAQSRPDGHDDYDSDSTASHSDDSLFDHSDDSASSHSWTDDELSESDLVENDGGQALSDQHTKPGPGIPIGQHDADPQRETPGPDEQHSDSSRPENDRGPALSGQGPKSGPDSPVDQRDVDPQRRTPGLDDQRSDSGLSENDGGPALSEQPAKSRPDVPVGQHDGDPQLRTPGADEQRSDSVLSENDRGPALSEQHSTSHPDSLGDHHQTEPQRETTGTDETPAAEIPEQVHTPGAQDRASQDHTDPDPQRGPKSDEPMGRREQQLRNRLRDTGEVRDHPRVIDARDRLTAARTEVEDTRRMVEGDRAPEPGSNSAAALREMHDEAQSQLQEAHAAHEAAVEHAVQERYEELQAESEARIAAAQQDAVWMRESTEAQMLTAREHLHMATSHLKKARAEYETAKAELGTGMRDIETSQQRVETARNALRDSRNEYEQARAGNEPRPEYLKQLSREVKQRTRNLRDELIEHEALLTATGSNPEERAAVQRERRELAPAWRIQEAFGNKVEQRAAVWRKALSRQQSDPEAQARVEELRQGLEEQEAAYPQAVENFKTTMLGVIEDRLAGVENAKKPDRDAYEAGLADKRAAMQAASRKALAAADAVQKAAFVFRDEVLRKTTETDPVTGRRASDYEVDRLVRVGTRAERVAAMPEWMTRRDPESRTPRETQMLAYVLTEFGPADMKGGEGKTLLMIMAGYRDARVHGVVNSLTSSDPLVVDMMNEVRTYLGSHHPDAGVDLVHLQESEPFPQWAWDARDQGRSLLVVGTKEAVIFAGLHEAHAMVDEIERAGAPADVVAGLRDWLRTEPHVDELADHLNAVAQEHGSSRRFRPLPEGVGNFDEVDTAFDGQVRGVLSPGAREDANLEQVAELKDAYEKFRVAVLDHGLSDKDFGRPENTKGLWHARLSDTAVEKLAAATGGDRNVVLAAAKQYTNFALARWGLKRGTDFITSREHDKVMLIHAKTTDKLSWDREKASETRLQELGQYLDVVEGVTVRGDHPEDSLTMSLNQWIGSRYLKNPKGVSGTAKEVEDVMYDSWGGARDERGDYFGVPEIERFYKSKLGDPDQVEYGTREAKFKGMATRVIDVAKISFTVQDGTIVGIEQTGRPVWHMSLDNAEIRGNTERLVERVVDKPGGGRMVEETRIELNHWRDKELSERGVTDWVDAIVDQRMQAYAREHGLTIKDGVKFTYTAIDADWYEQHGGGDAAEIKAAELVKQFGAPGSVMFINKSGVRGTDPKPTAAAKALGGVLAIVSGGPAFSMRVVLQAIWRAARGGSGEDRENGGTPGSAEIHRSPEDFRAEIEDAQAVREITQFVRAIDEWDRAADRYEADPSAEKQDALDKADERVDETKRVLREETTPRLQRRAEEQLLAPHRVHEDAEPVPGERDPLPGEDPAAHRANAPPAGEKAGARPDGSSADTTRGARPKESSFDGSSDFLRPNGSGASGRTTSAYAPPAGETYFGPALDKIFDSADSHSAGRPNVAQDSGIHTGTLQTADDGPRFGLGPDATEIEHDPQRLAGTGETGAHAYPGADRIRVFDEPHMLLADPTLALTLDPDRTDGYPPGTHIYLARDDETIRLTVTDDHGLRPEDPSTGNPGEPVTGDNALDLIRGHIDDADHPGTTAFIQYPPPNTFGSVTRADLTYLIDHNLLPTGTRITSPDNNINATILDNGDIGIPGPPGSQTATEFRNHLNAQNPSHVSLSTPEPAHWGYSDPSGDHHPLVTALANTLEITPRQLHRKIADHLDTYREDYHPHITTHTLDVALARENARRQQFDNKPRVHDDNDAVGVEHARRTEFDNWITAERARALEDVIAALGDDHTTDHLSAIYPGLPFIAYAAADYTKTNHDITASGTRHTVITNPTPGTPIRYLHHNPQDRTYRTGQTSTGGIHTAKIPGRKLVTDQQTVLHHIFKGHTNQQIVEYLNTSNQPDGFTYKQLEMILFTAAHDLGLDLRPSPFAQREEIADRAFQAGQLDHDLISSLPEFPQPRYPDSKLKIQHREVLRYRAAGYISLSDIATRREREGKESCITSRAVAGAFRQVVMEFGIKGSDPAETRAATLAIGYDRKELGPPDLKVIKNLAQGAPGPQLSLENRILQCLVAGIIKDEDIHARLHAIGATTANQASISSMKRDLLARIERYSADLEPRRIGTDNNVDEKAERIERALTNAPVLARQGKLDKNDFVALDTPLPEPPAPVATDGSAAHQSPSAPSRKPQAPPPNECVPVTLAAIKARNNSRHIFVPPPAGLRGYSRLGLEICAGAPLHDYGTHPNTAHRIIIDHLLASGPGATAFVGHTYTTPHLDKDTGVGAHGYWFEVVPDGGAVTIRDATTGRQFSVPPTPRHDLAKVSAICYTADGEILAPPGHTTQVFDDPTALLENFDLDMAIADVTGDGLPSYRPGTRIFLGDADGRLQITVTGRNEFSFRYRSYHDLDTANDTFAPDSTRARAFLDRFINHQNRTFTVVTVHQPPASPATPATPDAEPRWGLGTDDNHGTADSALDGHAGAEMPRGLAG
ncbi:hypothetical protein [Nocardia sp. NPDC004604]|uniref:WXG100-like domain-containing protein n=1 Tax=Nocardia sp. NPDC004604 TaxID=3157013 RepID=UPI0033BE1034